MVTKVQKPIAQDKKVMMRQKMIQICTTNKLVCMNMIDDSSTVAILAFWIQNMNIFAT